MQLEIGNVVEGKVVKITKFGAFVKLESGLSGLVHISEISKSFVVEIENFVHIGDNVKVKVLSNDNGKIGLSIKQAQTNDLSGKLPEEKSAKSQKADLGNPTNEVFNKKPAIYKKPEKKDSNLTFEEMLSKFKKNSEEKLSDIKRNSDNKRSSYSRRR